MVKPYIPSRGDIIFVNLNPQKGREQAGKRPVLVLSKKAINKTGLAFVCPITSKEKGILMEVPLPEKTKTKGVALPFQVKMIDWQSRGISFLEKCPLITCVTVSHFVNKIQGIE